jgi:hypothetical protein
MHHPVLGGVLFLDAREGYGGVGHGGDPVFCGQTALGCHMVM